MIIITDEYCNVVKLSKEEMEIIMEGVQDRKLATEMFGTIDEDGLEAKLLQKLDTLDY
jgi:hypothetical protein